MIRKRIFISADHGLSIVYFLQTDLVPTLLSSGVQVILLTDEGIKEKISQRFGSDGLVVEGLRLRQARAYLHGKTYPRQWWLDFFRRAGASSRMNLETVNNYVNWVQTEAPRKRKVIFPIIKLGVSLLRHYQPARKALVRWQNHFTPLLYKDLFTKYQPDLVVASTPGWRLDRYLLREANQQEIPTAAIVLGWDNPSSHGLPGTQVDRISCWSEAQKQELMLGSDWLAYNIHIGGIPSYDGYFRRQWVIPKEEYYLMHSLEKNRKLLSYACSFVTYSPNIQNIEALAQLVTSNELLTPCQLLVRLHPNHFTNVKRWANEREQIQRLVSETPHLHLVAPVPLGGELGYYSGEDMTEKSSMMAHSDVFITVYSTMVVEAAIHDVPIVSAVIDSNTGWPGEYSLPLSKIGGWPTHSRFRLSGAGRVVANLGELKDTINAYLLNRSLDQEERRKFVKQECTFTDGSAGKVTANYILNLVNSSPRHTL